jgi:hypothetical protein
LNSRGISKVYFWPFGYHPDTENLKFVSGTSEMPPKVHRNENTENFLSSHE